MTLRSSAASRMRRHTVAFESLYRGEPVADPTTEITLDEPAP
nr:hypothetical protein [Salinibacterium sp.]